MTSFSDLSHHNAGVSLTAYAAVHDRVALKATEGGGYVDPTFGDRWRQAGALGLRRVAYHFDRAAYDGGAQFGWLIDAVIRAGGLRPGDLLCLDSEDTQTPNRASASAAAFTHAAAAAGYPGCVYTGRWFANPYSVTAGILHPSWRWLWLSDYTVSHTDDGMPLPNGWARSQVIARQFTSTATVPGVTGPCDYSRVLHDWLTTEDDMSAEDVKAITDYLASDQFMLAVRQRAVIPALSDPTHAYLQDELQPLKDGQAQQAAQLRVLAEGQQALADAVRALVGQPQVAGTLHLSGDLQVTEGPQA